MSITNYSRPVLYSESVEIAVDAEGLAVVAAPAEDQDGNEIVLLTVSAGPTLFDIHLSAEDARRLAEHLNSAADVHLDGGAS